MVFYRISGFVYNNCYDNFLDDCIALGLTLEEATQTRPIFF